MLKCDCWMHIDADPPAPPARKPDPLKDLHVCTQASADSATVTLCGEKYYDWRREPNHITIVKHRNIRLDNIGKVCTKCLDLVSSDFIKTNKAHLLH